jgi:hypothetical protein
VLLIVNARIKISFLKLTSKKSLSFYINSKIHLISFWNNNILGLGEKIPKGRKTLKWKVRK